jgi:hypothetical protein
MRMRMDEAGLQQGSASGMERRWRMKMVFSICKTGLNVCYAVSPSIIHGNVALLAGRKIRQGKRPD